MTMSLPEQSPQAALYEGLAGMYDLADRYGIRVAGSVQEGYDPRTFYESELLGNKHGPLA